MPALCSDAAGWISSQTIVGDVEVPWWAARCRRLFSSPGYVSWIALSKLLSVATRSAR